ncbi:MAG: hypothetical protein HS111_16175 [Kofleriaceae bacterium]|nr:hypothetical protein [Kofleriaceae bacterium]
MSQALNARALARSGAPSSLSTSWAWAVMAFASWAAVMGTTSAAALPTSSAALTSATSK